MPKKSPSSSSTKPSSRRLEVRTQKLSRKKILIIVLIVLITLVSAGSIFVVYSYFNNKPEKVLADALGNTLSDISSRQPLAMSGQFMFAAKGDQPLKIILKTKSSLVSPGGQSKIDATVTFANKTYHASGELRVIDDSVLYFKFDNLKIATDSFVQDVPDFTAFKRTIDPVVSKLEAKWVRVTRQDAQKITGANEQNIEKCTQTLHAFKVHDADKKQLKKFFNENRPLIASESLKDEVASGKSSFHYKVNFNHEGTKQFFVQALSLDSFKNLKDGCGLTEQNILESKSGALPSEIELWVGKKERRLTKIRINIHNKNSEVEFVGELDYNSQQTGVKVPTEFISISELESDLKALTLPSTSTF